MNVNFIIMFFSLFMIGTAWRLSIIRKISTKTQFWITVSCVALQIILGYLSIAYHE